jgi:ketosteroid isomerase-like protein
MTRKALLIAISALLMGVSLFDLGSVSSKPSTLRIADRQIESDRSSTKRIEVVKRFVRAVEAKDIDTVNQLLADNIVLEQPYSQMRSGGVRLEGKPAASAFFSGLFGRFSQVRFVDVVFRQSQFDNTVIMEGRGDFVVASNRSPYRNQYIGVIEVSGDRIVMIREYFNPAIQPDTSNPR